MNGRQRRDILFAAGSFLAAPFAAEAQRPDSSARIGFLSFDLAGNPRAPESEPQSLLHGIGKGGTFSIWQYFWAFKYVATAP